MPQIELLARDLETLRTILARHVPGREVCVIGSRVSGRAKPSSDLDLVIMGDVPMLLTVRGALRDDLDKSNLPFAVDLVEWASASDGFRRLIGREGESLPTLTPTPAVARPT